MSEFTERLKTGIADRYVIERELGAGGMATVYLAHDVKHDRKVALKVLRPELAALIGAERFLQEIKVTANLQHSHILPLYDSGAVEGFLFYVMPYVEGETLRTRINKEKQLGVEDAVQLTRAIAAALEHAHKQGVVHRDIKPENILLRENDPLIADFGIALALSHAGGNRLTETGLSIGTPHYMSPEQAMGDRELDARSDVYSLAAVLYEMLTGDPPYTGSTAQAIVAKVITEKAPEVTSIRDTVPAHVGMAIHKALAKLPADRFHSAADFAEALAKPGSVTVPDTHFASAEPVAAPHRRITWRTMAIAAGVLLLAGVAAWGWLRTTPQSLVSRFEVGMSTSVPLRTGGNGRSIAIAPDGSRFVYIGGDGHLYVRDMGQLESRPLPGNAEHSPFFSPDGDWVGFYEQPFMKKVALAGGPPLTVTDASVMRGASWGEDGTIVFTPNTTSPLLRVSAGGGAVDTVTHLDSERGENSHRWPEWLPGQHGIVFTIYHGSLEDAEVAVVSLETGEIRPLVAGMDPHYVETGHLVYVAATGALLAVPFDLARMQVTGSPVSLAEGILVKTQVQGEFAISKTGTLLYVSGEGARVGLNLVDSTGQATQVVEDLPGGFAPRLSPDGRKVAVRVSQEGTPEIWIYDLELRTLSRLTFEGGNDYPEWSPDGATVYYSSSAGTGERDIRRRAADGSGDAEVVLERLDPQWEIDLSPVGGIGIVREISAETGHDLVALPIEPPGEARPYIQSQFNERSPTLSPDGHWAAYTSNESGQDEIYVRAFPDPTGRWQISAAGGQEPLWSQDGNSIYYRNSDSLFAVSVQTQPTFAVGRRRLMFRGGYQGNQNHTNYDRHPRTGQFVMLGQTESASTMLVIVLNWFDELRARMGGGR